MMLSRSERFLSPLRPLFVHGFRGRHGKERLLREFFRGDQCKPCRPCPEKSLRNSLQGIKHAARNVPSTAGTPTLWCYSDNFLFKLFIRQTNIIFGEHCLSCFRAREVIELGNL